MSDIELDYDYLGQQALRQVVVDVLKITADLGEAPGKHHFYIEFMTNAPGVQMPEHLKETYPERMTIVLQHQFHNLVVSDDRFSVSLSFNRKPADLTIPFEAISSFADPSVEFGLRFEQTLPDPALEQPDEKETPPSAGSVSEFKDNNLSKDESDTYDESRNGKSSDDKDSAAKEKSDGADVVSLDAFRKK